MVSEKFGILEAKYNTALDRLDEVKEMLKPVKDSRFPGLDQEIETAAQLVDQAIEQVNKLRANAGSMQFRQRLH